MEDRFKLDNRIKEELTIKAGEAKPSAGMLPRIINRIEAYEGGKENMLKGRIPNINIKKLAIVSLCAVLLISGMMFTFSEDVRAAAMDAIRTIFVLDKTEDGYALVEKTDQEEIHTLMAGSSGSQLTDEELAKKVGFPVSIPKELDGGYKLITKGEAVGIRKPISYEASLQIGPELNKAINDDAAFISLSEYKPYRSVSGLYKNESETLISIDMWLIADTSEEKGTDVTLKTNAGNIKGLWIELARADYSTIEANGSKAPDMYTKPEGIVKSGGLAWDLNGVRYLLCTPEGGELTMEEAVNIAESFIAQQ